MATHSAPHRLSPPHHSAPARHSVLRFWPPVPWHRKRRTPWDEFCAQLAADRHLLDWLLC
jgi:hypothetical protein